MLFWIGLVVGIVIGAGGLFLTFAYLGHRDAILSGEDD